MNHKETIELLRSGKLSRHQMVSVLASVGVGVTHMQSEICESLNDVTSFAGSSILPAARVERWPTPGLISTTA